MRHITQQGLDLIKQFEGFQPNVYLCPGGYSTIGYGHVVKDPKAFRRGITLMEAEELLRKDVATAERAVDRLIPIGLYPGQFDALVSFTFNLGSGALQSSTLRRKILREDHEAAAAQFQRWIYAGGRPLRGLLKRRLAEAKMYAEARHAVPREGAVLPWLVYLTGSKALRKAG